MLALHTHLSPAALWDLDPVDLETLLDVVRERAEPTAQAAPSDGIDERDEAAYQLWLADEQAATGQAAGG